MLAKVGECWRRDYNIIYVFLCNNVFKYIVPLLIRLAEMHILGQIDIHLFLYFIRYKRSGMYSPLGRICLNYSIITIIACVLLSFYSSSSSSSSMLFIKRTKHECSSRRRGHS